MTWEQILDLIRTIGGIVGLLAVPGGIAAVLLNRKGANKKLEIEEGGLDVQTFNAQRAAYSDLLDRANAATNEALTELSSYKAEREQNRYLLEDTNTKLDDLRNLFQSVVTRSNILLTPEEQAIFDNTKPTVRRTRPRPS